MFETKLLVIAGQSEPNEFSCSPIALINAEWWTAGAPGAVSVKAKPAASPTFLRWISTSACEYFSVLAWMGFYL